MDHASATVLVFFSFCQWMTGELVHGLLARMTFGTGVYLILLPTILSGTLALLVKHLIALRVLPVCKLVSGGLLLLLVSWYIDRICRNNAYLLVRFVGLAIIFCAAVGVVLATGDGPARGRSLGEVTVVAASDTAVAGD